MFTGIIQGLGEVVEAHQRKLSITLPSNFKVKKGESVAVNGVCLTVTALKGKRATFDCMPETLRVTTLGDLKTGDRVNLEPPLTLKTPIGGHLVQGHVDGVGEIVSERADREFRVLTIRVPQVLLPYIIKKGSIALDGTSLTITEKLDDRFSVGLIPETLRRTVLGRKKPGDKVNIEVDLIAKYAESLIAKSRTV